MINMKTFQIIGNRLIVKTPFKHNYNKVVIIFYITGLRGLKPWKYGKDVSDLAYYVSAFSFGALGVGISVDTPMESDGTW